MGLVSTVQQVTNTAPSGYDLVITDNQKTENKPVTIAGGGSETLGWNVPWYTDKNYKWPDRSLTFEFKQGKNSVCQASVWQHGVGVLWEQGTEAPANPSTGYGPALAQEGASFDITVTLNIPPSSQGDYTMTLANTSGT